MKGKNVTIFGLGAIGGFIGGKKDAERCIGKVSDR